MPMADVRFWCARHITERTNISSSQQLYRLRIPHFLMKVIETPSLFCNLPKLTWLVSGLSQKLNLEPTHLTITL